MWREEARYAYNESRIEVETKPVVEQSEDVREIETQKLALLRLCRIVVDARCMHEKKRFIL